MLIPVKAQPRYVLVFDDSLSVSSHHALLIVLRTLTTQRQIDWWHGLTSLFLIIDRQQGFNLEHFAQMIIQCIGTDVRFALFDGTTGHLMLGRAPNDGLPWLGEHWPIDNRAVPLFNATNPVSGHRPR